MSDGAMQGAKVLLDGRGVKVPGHEHGNWVGPTVRDAPRPSTTADVARRLPRRTRRRRQLSCCPVSAVRHAVRVDIHASLHTTLSLQEVPETPRQNPPETPDRLCADDPPLDLITQVITNVTTDMECYKQEIFGPVLVCQPRPCVHARALSLTRTHSREPESDPRITQLPTLSIHARRPH